MKQFNTQQRLTGRRTGALLSTALLAALALSACGGQSLAETTPTPNNGGAVAAAVPAPAEDLAKAVIDNVKADPALKSALPAGIQSAGIKMTTSEGYPPMEMFAKDGKTLIGVDPSMGRAIANKLGVPLAINNEDFNAQIPGVTTGRYDWIMSSMTDNSERRKTVTFVDYVRSGNGWVVKAGNPSKMGDAASACGKTIAVVDNGSSLTLAESYDAACTAAGKKGVNILKFAGDQEAILQVRNGRADAGINDYPVAAYRAQTSDGALDAVAIPGGESPWGIAMNPANKDLVATVQKAVQALIDDGSYAKILDAWNVAKMNVGTATINDGK